MSNKINLLYSQLRIQGSVLLCYKNYHQTRKNSFQLILMCYGKVDNYVILNTQIKLQYNQYNLRLELLSLLFKKAMHFLQLFLKSNLL